MEVEVVEAVLEVRVGRHKAHPSALTQEVEVEETVLKVREEPLVRPSIVFLASYSHQDPALDPALSLGHLLSQRLPALPI